MSLRLSTFLLLLIITLFAFQLVAQTGMPLPRSTYSGDWHLEISDVHTTTLIFPHDVVSVDRGTPDVLTQTLNEVTNIVKVKSASESMVGSSLTVITSGGMVYTFRVCYNANPATLTYQLAPLRPIDGTSTPVQLPAPVPATSPAAPIDYTVPIAPPPVKRTAARAGDGNQAFQQPRAVSAVYYPPETASQLGPNQEAMALRQPAAPRMSMDPSRPSLGTPLRYTQLDSFANPMGMSYGRTVINSRSLYEVSDRIHGIHKRGSVRVDRGSGSTLQLDDIWIVDDILYYRFTLACQSNIAYDIDFWRFYVVDAKQRKRTAVQERDVDLLEVYTDGSEPSRVGSRESRTFVVAVNKFTIPDQKRLVLEVFERDGGRHHSLKIKNRDIVKAYLVSTPNQQAR